MTLFVLSIPLMIVMIALAVVPLVVMSRAEHRIIATEARGSDCAQREHADALVAEPSLTVAA
jgi:hypothetical protein